MLLVVAGIAVGQEPSKRWKSRNDRGNRYEGRIEIPVASPTIEILSFLAFRESYSKGDDLTVRFFVPEAGDLVLQARELEERVQYWMEAKGQDWTTSEWNEFGPWPTKILAREQIPAGNLGLLIHLHGDEETTLLPAIVYHSAPPRTVESYTLHFRLSSDLSEMTYRLYAGGDELTRDKLVDLDAAEPLTIRLKTAGLPEGQLRLELEGKFRGRTCGDEKGIRCPGGSYALYHRPLDAPNAPAEDSR